MSHAAPRVERAAATERDARWASVATRNPEADGTFYYSVSTTGVYCRPSCAARLARPEHVRFHQTRREAEQAGFRPCKRCKPDQSSEKDRQAAMISKVCRLIEQSEQMIGLERLAEEAQLSASHFHRLFKAVTGVTPRQYAVVHRAKRVRLTLERSRTVTEAIYEAGYNSNGRFYETSNDILGMTPSSFRTGGEGVTIRFAVGECSLGSILVAQSEQGICAILLGDDPNALIRDLQNRFPRAHMIGGDATFERLVSRVVGFVEAPAIGLDLPLDIRGTAFQRRVWQALQRIPSGERMNYTDIAIAIGAPKSVRAVARACGANALAVAIPCHRVVRRDGSLSGYRWGIARKRALLERDRRS